MRLLTLLIRVLPDVTALVFVLMVQSLGVMLLWRKPEIRASRTKRAAVLVGLGCSCAIMVLAVLLRFARVANRLSPWWSGWGRGFVIAWAMLSVAWVAAIFLSSWLPPAKSTHSASRRGLLLAVRAVLFGAPAAALAYGTFIQRTRIVMREERIVIPNLPPDLDGLRLVQLTDLHVSPFLSIKQLEGAIAMANETRANIAFVTGDLITTGDDPLDECLRALGKLRGDAGVFGCMGNHEAYVSAQDYVETEGARRGIRFLRSSAMPLRFGNATLNLAGVDYQTPRQPYLAGTEKLIVPGAMNMLLSHNPDVFPIAAQKGFDFTLSGHTHGGQVRVEILGADLNLARFFTPYVDGIYRQGKSSIFVSRGIGTIGLPTRLGSPPEVALIHLCRS